MRPLREGLRSSDPLLQKLAVRAFGRLEDPAFMAEVVPFLKASVSDVRIETAQALAQMAVGRGASDGGGGAQGAAAARAAAAGLAYAELAQAADSERDIRVRAALARSLSRIPLALTEQVRKVELLALSLLTTTRDSAAVVMGALSMERLIRLNPRVAPLLPQTADSLRATLLRATTPPAARRYAYMSLQAAGRVDEALLVQTIVDTDEQVRRLSTASAAALQNTELRERLLRPMLRDGSQLVRLEAARGWLRAGPASECSTLLFAVDDPAINVGLTAIDALAQAADRCPATERGRIEEVLAALARRLEVDGTAGYVGTARATLHKGAHALATLARLNPGAARPFLLGVQTHSSWVARMYAANAAAAVADTATLTRLALNPDGNVRAAAIAGLVRVAGQTATPLYLAGLEHTDHNVVRVAAGALRQSTAGLVVRDALLASLARITAEQKETSRDARIALIDRIGELASPADSNALSRYITDFDPAVAGRASQVLTRWLGRPVSAAPIQLPAADPPPADAPVVAGTRLRFVMSLQAGGSVFEMELLADEAPYTVARVLRLVRAGYYNGLTFHRVAPNFVVQGGSPGANEYVGDGPFMRDELWLHSHQRGSVGISTRGRDTGDAQIFINTIDSPRLDFDYTVFARLTYGMPLVDGVLEGDVIERVEVLPPR
jgi:cyclophilin family peptidyl-prolyl cis-trans isomerase/HEAT repeat protein